MNNFLYGLAIALIIIWLIGFFGLNAGGFIHLLLVIAVISILLRIIQGKRTVGQQNH